MPFTSVLLASKRTFFAVALMFPRELIELSLSHFWWRYIFVSIACMCFLPDVALGPMKPVSVEAMETRHRASTFSFHDLGSGRSGIIDTTESGSFGKYFLCQIGQVCIIGKPSTGWKGPTSCTFENGVKLDDKSYGLQVVTKRGIRLEDGILGRCLENCQGFQDGHFLKFGGCFFLRFKVRLDQCTLQCGAYESGVFRENLAK